MPTNARVVKERQALEMQRAGFSYEQIGEQIGLSASGAWKLCLRALSRAPVMNVDHHRAVQTDALTRLWRALYPAARLGDVKSVAECRKLSESLRRLNGWDAPIRLDATLRTKLDQDIQNLVDEMAALPPVPAGGGSAYDDAPPPLEDDDMSDLLPLEGP